MVIEVKFTLVKIKICTSWPRLFYGSIPSIAFIPRSCLEMYY